MIALADSIRADLKTIRQRVWLDSNAVQVVDRLERNFDMLLAHDDDVTAQANCANQKIDEMKKQQ